MTSKQFLYLLGPFIVFLLFLGMCMPRRTPVTEAAQIKQTYLQHIDNLDSALAILLNRINENASATAIRQAFYQARLSYKQIEFITEYYHPHTAKAINGPAIDEVEEDDPLQNIVPATGFQVAEQWLFPEYQIAPKVDLLQEISLIKSSLNRLRLTAETTSFNDKHIFEAVRQQIFRMITLGISGFDSPLALYSIPEAASSLKTLQETLAFYHHTLQQKSPALSSKLDNTFTRAIAFLQAHPDFNSFDRAAFITDYANPLTSSLAEARQILHIAVPGDLRAFSSDALTLFDEGAFQVDYYAPAYEAHITPERTLLGQMLFFDPLLSGDGSRSCASCHNPAKAFTDAKAKSIAFNFEGVVRRNAPTIINAALQRSLFHDMRVHFLEDQASDVLGNKREMHGSFKKVVKVLNQSPEYIELFARSFNTTPQSALTEDNIKIAIASYVRSLISLNSRFDQYMRGDKSQLNRQEMKGFNVFMGKGKCGTCHFMPLFNGTVPPDFTTTEAEILGVPATKDTLHPVLDEDLGKFALHQKDLHKFAFKTPSIRNIALTAPYMHNGVFESMEEVIDFYNRGGGQGLGINLPTQTLPADQLRLSKEEKQALIAFMKSLTDTDGLKNSPTVLPSFPGQHTLNKRKIGGTY
jgi:cytochrome c peroxidase